MVLKVFVPLPFAYLSLSTTLLELLRAFSVTASLFLYLLAQALNMQICHVPSASW